MNEEPTLEMSLLCQSISSEGNTVHIDIFRLEGGLWALEIEDEYGNSTVWDDEFESDSAALTEAQKSIAEQGIKTFIGPVDGKGQWR